MTRTFWQKVFDIFLFDVLFIKISSPDFILEHHWVKILRCQFSIEFHCLPFQSKKCHRFKQMKARKKFTKNIWKCHLIIIWSSLHYILRWKPHLFAKKKKRVWISIRKKFVSCHCQTKKRMSRYYSVDCVSFVFSIGIEVRWRWPPTLDRTIDCTTLDYAVNMLFIILFSRLFRSMSLSLFLNIKIYTY